MASQKVAVVTGANKGIGYFIVRRLCKEFKGDVLLTSRSVERGQAAVKQIESEGLKVKFHQLDINDDKSIAELKSYLETEYGGLDILVNNAAIAFKRAATEPYAEQARVTIDCNYFGTLRVCKALLPLLRSHSRVVYVSSTVGLLKVVSPPLREKFSSPNLSESELSQLMDQFVSDVKSGIHEKNGWPTNSAYGVSKVGTTALMKVHARLLASRGLEDVIVNACCPGWCQTDMSSHTGHKTAEEGADTPTYLALLPPGSPNGEFWSDRKVIQW